MLPDLKEDTEAFLARENTPNDVEAFEKPFDFRCVVGLPTQHGTATFRVTEEGICLLTKGEMQILNWHKISRILVNPHTTKVWVRGQAQPFTIVGAVRPAILGAVQYLKTNGPPITHELHLESDVGQGLILLKCTCDWWDNLGYTTTPERAWAATQEHLREAHEAPAPTNVRHPQGEPVHSGPASDG